MYKVSMVIYSIYISLYQHKSYIKHKADMCGRPCGFGGFSFCLIVSRTTIAVSIFFFGGQTYPLSVLFMNFKDKSSPSISVIWKTTVN